MKIFISLIIGLLCFIQLSAQDSNYMLPLKTGDKVIHENINDKSLIKNRLTNQIFDGKYYVLLQFYQLPDNTIHKKIKALGIDLTEYISANTYRATIPEGIDIASLTELNVRAVDKLAAIEKIEPLLLGEILPEHVEVVAGKLDIQLKIHDDIPIKAVMNELQSFQIEYLEKVVSGDNYLQIRVLKEELERIASMPFVNYACPVQPEATPLSAGATRASVVRAEYLNHVYGLKGEGVIAGIFEHGNVGHIDLRGNTVFSVPDASCPSGHAEIVCSMAGAQGILRPTWQGVAPELTMFELGGSTGSITSALGQYSNPNNVSDPLNRMVLTNQSFVGGNKSRVDQELLDYPETMQVAAAGNSGVLPTTEANAPIPRYYTMGGLSFPGGGYNRPSSSNMVGKNLITVGGIDMYNKIIDGVDNGSSKGPTWDGRIKPEVVAIAGGTPPVGIAPFGATYSPGPINCATNNYIPVYFGTSFAAPQVVGGLALLYEYYRNHPPAPHLLNTNPSGAFMKAIVCNTADDLGNPGPDFVYGFGKMNLRKAIKVLENEWYSPVHSFSSGAIGEHTHQIVIPPDKEYHQLKVMLYWADRPVSSTVNDYAPHLVNNLDVRVNTPANGTILPLVPYPDPVDPTQPAVNTVDNLNNIEQVVVTAQPTQFLSPGTYEVKVNPTQIASAQAQSYYVVWEFIEPGVKITSPYQDELMSNAGAGNYYVEWDYNGGDDDAVNDFQITITDDNGYQLTTEVDGKLRAYPWHPSDHLDINSSNVTVKVERLNTNYSDETIFSVYNEVNPYKLTADYVCGNQVCLSWNIEFGDVDGAPPAYFTVYKYVEEYDGNNELIDNYMQPVLTTSDYSATIDFDSNKTEEWYAVSTTYYNPTTDKYIETTRCNARRFAIPSITGCSGNETCSAVNCPPGIVGTSCNDDDPCTTNDVYDANCNCAGTITDTDGNGEPDAGTCTDCPINLVIENSDIPGDYEAAISIKTDENALVSVSPGEQLTLSAGKYIDLNPNFIADNGSVFLAEIDGCDYNPQALVEDESEKIQSTSVEQITMKNYPNPFTGQTTIEFTLLQDTPVTLSVSDVTGRQIATLVNSEEKTEGTHQVTFDGSSHPAGMYYYTIQAGHYTGTQKMTLIK